MPPELSFKPEQNYPKQLILLHDAQIPQEAKDKCSSLLEGDYNSSVSKSTMDVGRTNPFQMDIPTAGLPSTHKPYPIPLKYQNFIGKEIWLCHRARQLLSTLRKCLVEKLYFSILI